MKNNTWKKGLVLGIIMLFVGASALPSIAMMEKSRTSNYGRDILYVGGGGMGNYTTIQDAIDNASDGDTVFVYDDSSPYYEHVWIYKTIKLIGENKDTTIIDGSGSSNAVRIKDDDAEVSGFTIRNSGTGSSYGGIKIESSSNIISGNIISNNYGNGILLGYSSVGNTISGYVIKTNYQNGIYLDESIGNTISENIINKNHRYGVKIYYSSDNIITSNTIQDNYYDGVYILTNSNGNTINGNIISDNIENGVTVRGTNSNTINANNISDNGYSGIRLYHSSNNLVSENNICNNGWDEEGGMYLTYESNNNDIYHNNFIANFNWNAKDECMNTWDDDYPSGGNYWDDYTGEDNNGDGIGDVPYPISGGDNEDGYPLMEPFVICVEGIDVSHYQNEQGDIDWVKVYNSGKRFAFAKATGGTGFPDPYFETNMNEGTNAGILMGAYHFAYPEYNTASDEAQFFISEAGNYIKEGYLRPALDIEDDPVENSYPYKLGKEALSNWIHEFMSTIKDETGVEPILYVNSYYANFLDSSLIQYNLWIAHPEVSNPDTGIWDDWDFWQYTDEGSVPGISGNVDLDKFNGDLTSLNTFVISGSTPNKPTIDGPDSGKPGIQYDYTFTAIDPDGDNVRYLIEWGDTTSDITGFNPSGTDVIVSHTWTTKGTYTISAKAEDTNGLIGPESTKTVTMPKNKPFNFNLPLLNWLFERFPNLFPILRHIIGL